MTAEHQEAVTLRGTLHALQGDPALAQALETLSSGDGSGELTLRCPQPLQPFVIAATAARLSGKPVIAVTATNRDAELLTEALGSLLDAGEVGHFPSWETLPHEKLSPRADTVGERLSVLRRLAHPEEHGALSVVVTPIRSMLQPIISGLGDVSPVNLKAGDTIPLDDIVRALVATGYSRVEMVEKRGEFAVRGGIVDVFPPTEQHPVRVELWGDDVDEMRYFSVADQRSLGEAPEALWAPPCRELLLTDDVRARAGALLREHPDLAEMLEPISEGTAVEGMESLIPVLVSEDGGLRLFVEELAAGSLVLVCDPQRAHARAIEMVHSSQEFLDASWAVAAGGGDAPIDLGAAAYRSIEEVREAAEASGQLWWELDPLSEGDIEGETALDAHAVEQYVGDPERLMSDVRGYLADGWTVVVTFAGHGTAQRAVERFADADVPAQYGCEFRPGVVTVTTAMLGAGFVAPTAGLVVITESDLTSSRGQASKPTGKMPSRRRNAVDPLQLQPGDFVVHEQHGVGKYVEMVRRTVNGGEREYLTIEYAAGKRGQPADRLFVPTDQLDQVTRYVGGEAPSLNKLGGSDWAKTKGRARKAVKEIAGELIRLYAARTSAPGHAFGPDTPWQRELEDAFPYVETADQLAAIDEVKSDMEKSVPMDRVISGDVGYGKTEIAVRAAFKAVQDGKQVAILVPTTLLSQQHFQTFSERFSQFPVKIAELSRFTPQADVQATMEGVADGTIDVAIGTHRLLQPTTRFKDLGLVIVDEEQRFGVEHKEYLKQIRTAVDMLTMSATPIPRTLEMSLTGIREMSTMLTPPEERHPILTFVGAQNDKQLVASIRRELLRDGQVFYLHNRVRSIDKAAAHIRDLVPEARVAVAHGQMGEDELERIMLGFGEREYDVLVATTIIEAGLDIPNANTLIVERADLLGLSQLHQIRGRVGRSRERAYAYFLYPPDRPLNDTAYDRLATIAQNTELGAGMAVAMKDLEIRGAGNLLGGEQSGHIAGVGFDLYVRMVGEAVADYRGDAPTEESVDVRIDLPVSAHVPHDYIEGERLRLEVYRKIAAVTDDAVADQVRAELADRYGPVPVEIENLISVAKLRALATQLGVTEISTQGKQIRFGPISLGDAAQMKLARLYKGSNYKSGPAVVAIPRPTEGAGLASPPLRNQAVIDWARGVLTDLVPVPATV
ncbi:transcription-repair coupling factor [Antricoccus suffuscus]|uniref:Transcription-repair-coupling factor n=1 Tax=Antricoccus suffuscus TaxID=1629062 RepID=A0A2T1A013_9ACTN|nr:transcription-repair coupling factor [Antricoccus suffuscus]PRZ41946.1 transcription-repair coupling factor [Antricoccus suffuscus]